MSYLDTYKRWWEGKFVGEIRVKGSETFWPTPPAKCTKVEFIGPPSACYGRVVLHLEGHDKPITVRGTGAHRPRKRDVVCVTS